MIRRRLVGTVVVIGAICAASYVVAQDNPPSLAGRWEGTIDVPGAVAAKRLRPRENRFYLRLIL